MPAQGAQKGLTATKKKQKKIYQSLLLKIESVNTAQIQYTDAVQ